LEENVAYFLAKELKGLLKTNHLPPSGYSSLKKEERIIIV